MKKTAVYLLTISILLGATLPLSAAQRHSPPSANHIKHLPHGAKSVIISGVNYWKAGSIYYRKGGRHYIAALPPQRAYFTHLPASAIAVRNHRHYYYYQNAYYKWQAAAEIYVMKPNFSPSHSYIVGDVFETLPSGSNIVHIKGIKYYKKGGSYFLPSLRANRSLYIVVNIN